MNTMRHYCTLFDSAYLPRGLVLYESLLKHSSEPFTLHVLPMDERCADALFNLQHQGFLECANVLLLRDVEFQMDLREARRSRSWTEYCWTMGSNLSCFMLTKYLDVKLRSIKEVTYLDADMMFFSDPAVIFDEIGKRSIAVIPHRLIPEKRHLEVNGKFNVSWVTFKGDIGRECVSHWAAQCRVRCSATVGCGDQVYLDEWPDKYGDALCIVKNIGAGLAPWNITDIDVHELLSQPGKPYVRDAWVFGPVVFYHYHEFAELPVIDMGQPRYRFTNYQLRAVDLQLIYRPYLEAYETAKATCTAVFA